MITGLLTAEEREALAQTMLVRRRLEDQYENLDQQQHHASALGMWIFLATEVMFFGTLFLSVAVLPLFVSAGIRDGERLNWIIGGTNTLVLLVSSLTIVLAVHYAKKAKTPAGHWLPARDSCAGYVLPVPQGT